LSIVPGTDSRVVSFPIGHRHVRGLLNFQDNVIEGRSTLLALTSTLSKLKGSSNTCVLLGSIGNSFLLSTLADIQVHRVEALAVAILVDEGLFNLGDAHSLGQFHIALPMDLSGLASLLDVENQVDDIIREGARNKGESLVEVVEVQSEAVVAKGHFDSISCIDIENNGRRSYIYAFDVTAGSGFRSGRPV